MILFVRLFSLLILFMYLFSFISCMALQGFPNTPSSFPFTIKENPGERYITLTREFPDETIEVKVREVVKIETERQDEDDEDNNETRSENEEEKKNETESEDENSSNDDDSCSDDNATSEEEEDTETDRESHLPMTMTISRVDGRSLKFEIDATIDDIKVKYMSLEEESDPDNKVEFSAPDFE